MEGSPPLESEDFSFLGGRDILPPEATALLMLLVGGGAGGAGTGGARVFGVGVALRASALWLHCDGIAEMVFIALRPSIVSPVAANKLQNGCPASVAIG